MRGAAEAALSNSERIATLQARLTLIQTAITATYTRGVASYSTEIQSLTSLGLDELHRQERAVINEIARLQRGSRFGPVGFKRITT